MSTHNDFMKTFYASLAEVVELDRADADRRSNRNYSTVTAFTAREIDHELTAVFAREYEAAKLMGIKL